MASQEIEDALEAGGQLLNLQSAGRDMLSALKQAESAIENDLCAGQNQENECWVLLRTVRAAIAKAEGR